MAKHFQKKGRRILGRDLQDWIKGFFGTNAALSIVILGLICFYLIREAIMFFPSHHEEMTLYRQTGQEYVGYIIDEVDGHTEIISLTNQAYFQELDEAYAVERGISDSFDALLDPLEDDGEDLIDAWDEALGDLEDAQDEGDAGVLAEAQEAEKKAAFAWKNFVSERLSSVKRSEIDTYNRLDDEAWSGLLGSMPEWDPLEGDPTAFVQAARDRMDEGMAEFREAKDAVVASGRDLKALQNRLVKIASEIKKDAVADQSAAARKEALEQGIQISTDEEKKAELQKQLDEIVILEEFPFAERTLPLEASKDEHREIASATRENLEMAVAKLPSKFASAPAAALIERVREKTPGYLETLEDNVEDASQWQWDEEVSHVYSAVAFFFGKDWVTNSSWHDFYGLLPLFTGSALISLIALAVAVPFSVGAAIYVNRLATRWEQNIIKPVIEMVQAIPSVVLGIFGILVLGEYLRDVSQWPGLSWIPGFPMQERLNILNAGLLLALMAVPTIFTLCEDALNNVPSAFSEASLALGASKLQTVMKVILPTASSGILAAILLGLGRVIGETMVVLLVAGNKIAMPDFGAGLGVITQPTHTMTGIIAQEMGEVAADTLHWRALFLVGLVLFTISLCINVAAQRIIRRLSHV
ncbi:MAG: phosphate ABC transporter permease subunit PstC [Verrucomicrobiaceae bacterium]